MKGNLGFEGWRGAGERYFVIFLVVGRLFGRFFGDGSNEIGYRRLRSWKMGGRRLEYGRPEFDTGGLPG